MAIADKRRAVVVGDTLGSDILGAQQSGLDAIWYNPKGLPLGQDLSPALIASNFDDIRNFILDGAV